MTELAGVMRLEVRQILGGKKIFLLALIFALPVGLFLLIAGAGQPPEDDETRLILLFILYPQVTCLLGPLLYATTIVQSELEQKTWIYLATRPVGRVRIVLGKYLSVAGCVGAAAAVSLPVSCFILGRDRAMSYLPAIMGASLLAVAGYSAVFSLIGAIAHRKGMAIALLYAMCFEIILSFFPALINRITVTHHLRAFVVGVKGIEMSEELRRWVGDTGLGTSLVVLTLIVAAALALTCWIVSRRQLVAAVET